jgi:hypothetical protein
MTLIANLHAVIDGSLFSFASVDDNNNVLFLHMVVSRQRSKTIDVITIKFSTDFFYEEHRLR